MNNTLHKLFIKRYYEQNAAFFLLLLLALFGLLNAHDALLFHRAIMTAITGSWKFCGIAILAIATYVIKCIAFCLAVATDRSNGFLRELEAIPVFRRFLLLFRVFTGVYLPAMIYCIAACVVGFSEGVFIIPVTLLLVQLVMCLFGAWTLLQKLRFDGLQSIFKLPECSINFKSRMEFMVLQYSFHSKKGAILAIKAFSIGLLQIMIWANENVLYKESVCVLMMFIISAHALLPQQYVSFSESRLRFLRNLPFSAFYRFSIYALTYAVLFLPELAFLFINGKESIPIGVIASIYALAVAQLSLCTSLLFHRWFQRNNYTVLIVAMFFIALILIASLQVWVMAILEGALALALFLYFFGKYEGA